MNVTFDLASFRAQLREKSEQMNEAARPAAQAGAQVIYEAARLNAPVSEKSHYFHIRGKKYGPFAPGNLRDAIYQAYSKDNSGPTRATYHVAFNHRKAPYGFMVHNGTSRAAAHPFLVRAIHDDGPRALEAMRVTFLSKLARPGRN